MSHPTGWERAGTVVHRLGVAQRERRLRERLLRLHPPPVDPRRVSIVVLTRDGRDRLARLLPALRRTLRHGYELLVVDNGSERPTRRFLAAQNDVEVLWAPANRSFSAGNNLAAERASGDVLCLLYDDVEPLGPRWLDRMLASLTDDVGVVGAQLVHPRQPLLAGTRRDLTVEHRGITFVPVLGEVPRAVDIRGDRPTVDGRTQEVAAVTGGCLVVERRTYMELGGLDEGYVYGAEDVDFCWRARRAGRRTCVVHDAVLLHHHGSGPHGDDPAARSRHEAANWSRFAARHGEDVSRAVTLDRLTGRAVLSRTRYRVAVLPAPGARWGDAAEALHQALGGTGWEADPPDGVGGRHVRAARVVRDDADLVLAVGPGIEPEALARPGRTRAVWLPEGRAAEPAGSSMDGWDVVVTTRDPAGAISTLRDALIARMGASRWDSGRLRTK